MDRLSILKCKTMRRITQYYIAEADHLNGIRSVKYLLSEVWGQARSNQNVARITFKAADEFLSQFQERDGKIIQKHLIETLTQTEGGMDLIVAFQKHLQEKSFQVNLREGSSALFDLTVFTRQ